MEDRSRRVLLLLALVVLALLAGCTARWSLTGHVVATEETADGHRITVELISVHAEDYFTNVTVYGYGPYGERVCTRNLDDFDDPRETVSVECAEFPQIVLFTSDELGEEPSQEGVVVVVEHSILGYRGFANGSHHWENVSTVEDAGNPPHGSELGTVPPFERLRCRQRWEEANVSVYPDANWTERPPRYPRVSENSEVAFTDPDRNGSARTVTNRTYADAPSVIRGPLQTPSNRTAGETTSINRSAFVRVVEWLEGEQYDGLADLPDGGDHVSQQDDRREVCREGAGHYNGHYVREYSYVVGEGDDVVGVNARYERRWHTPDGANSSAPPSAFPRVSDELPAAYRGANGTEE